MTRGQVAQGSFATRNLPQRCWQCRHPARARASRPGSRDPRSHVARPLQRPLDGSRWWCWQSSQFSCLRCHFGCSPGLFRRRTNCAAANGTRLSANRPAHGMNSMSSNWGTSRARSRGNVFRRRLSAGKRWGSTGFGAIRGGARGGRVPRDSCAPKEAGCCASHTRRAGLRSLISLAQPGPHANVGAGVRRLNESALQLPGPAGNVSELWVHGPHGWIPVAVMGTNRIGLCPRASTRSLRLDQTRCCGRRPRRERSSTPPVGHAGKASRLTA